LFYFWTTGSKTMENTKANLADLSQWKNYKTYRWFLHVMVWLVYTFTYSYLYALLYESVILKNALLQFSLSVWVDIFAAYFTVYYLMPKFLLKKKYKMFLLGFSLSAVFFIFLQRIQLGYLTYPYLYPESAGNFKFFRFNFAYTFFNIYVMTFILASVKLFEYWFVNQKQNQELQKQKMESELKFLKSQIHPHFLFNTLNNLYALTLDKSDYAPEVVVKLSDLLSYMLYECNAASIPLEKEIQHLNDYLDLEKIRYKEDLKANIDIIGKVSGKELPPLLLLPFVENAFKHGVSKNISNPWVNINLDIENEHLSFRVENNKAEHEQQDKTGYTEGIGLKNVRRRLELIYGLDYGLEIEESGKKFAIHLKLQLLSSTKKNKAHEN
jgi:two-component system, LytTR family, sensor kinase